MPMNKEIRRRHERYNCDMVVWLRPFATDEEFSLVDVENISPGGVLCHTTQPFEEGTLLELQISLLQQPDMITVKAKVVHVRSNDEDYNLGLQFLGTHGVNLPTFTAWLEAMFT